MKIVRVEATPLNVPLHIKLVGVDRRSTLSSCYVEVETDDGLIGHAFLGRFTVTYDMPGARMVFGPRV